MSIEIRTAEVEDAAQIIALIETLAAEAGISIALGPGEFRFTLEQEQEFINETNHRGNSLLLLAEADGQVVGVLTLIGGRRQSQRHSADLGISIAQNWRDQGIGRRLMSAAIDRARAGGVLKRIELFVFVRNKSALHLYESLGFVIEGRRRMAVFRDSEFHDDYLMALLL